MKKWTTIIVFLIILIVIIFKAKVLLIYWIENAANILASVDWFSIGIAVIASLIASALWYICTVLYDFQSRDKIDYLSELALDTASQFENAIIFNNYNVAVSQADRLHDLLFQIHSNIKPLTYSSSIKKLVGTYIFSVYHFLALFKASIEGYSGERETITRCEKFTKYLFDSEIYELTGSSALYLQLQIIQELNSAKRFSVLKTILHDNFFIINNKHITSKEICKKLVDLRSFKSEVGKKTHIQSFTFTKEEYDKFLDHHL